MTEPPYVGPVRRLFTVFDANNYSLLPDGDQRDVQNLLNDIETRAAHNAGLDRGGARVQATGDGILTAWPPQTSDVRLVVHYLRAFYEELVKVNKARADEYKIRVRLAVTAGISETASLGEAGRAPVVAARLVDSKQAHAAMRLAAGCLLVIVLDHQLFETVVKPQRLNGDGYVHVVITDKHREKYDAWIAVPGYDPTVLASLPGAKRRSPRPRSEDPPKSSPAARGRLRLLDLSPAVKAALITATGAVIAAAIAAASAMGGGGAGARVSTNAATSTSQAAGTPPSHTASTTATQTAGGALHLETTDNRRGTPVFSDDMGGAVAANALIPFDTQVEVKFWAPNLSDMYSVNKFYVIETAPWTGDYGSANTFANGDPIGQPGGTTIDPAVPQCPGT